MFSRRDILAIGAGGVAFATLGASPLYASAADDLIAELTGGADLGDGVIDLIAPEIAENGNAVPIDVTAEGAKSITLFGEGNPEPVMAKYNFGPLSPTRGASTRVRLAQTQDVIALAQMNDGSWQVARATVKVTIGGCGG